ncbi:hypothetical protein [Alloactinosynnema sp. L-07]|uniref:COG1470 family protein n=1 Tax=Alloactinosynnema sp. L-07 TaxID=1653480 RepID=UPI00065EEFB6|nr:hypothetical protein [Alloactinosynnema sp. L-07]CRK58099.1 hypothetical protein [Alloactinosynnema sp. L-07]
MFESRVRSGDFAVSAEPLSVRLGADNDATVVVRTRCGARPQSVAMSVSGLPSGVAARFDQPLLTAGGVTRLSLACADRAFRGIHPVTVTATNPAGEIASGYFSLTVDPREDQAGAARVWLNPTIETAQAGFLAQTRVTVTGGGAVRLGIRGEPPGARATFSPTVVYEGGQAIVWIFTAPDTPPGRYPVTITATDARGRAGAAVFTLAVNRWKD